MYGNAWNGVRSLDSLVASNSRQYYFILSNCVFKFPQNIPDNHDF